MIHVTKTYLPKRESLDQYIDQIYQSNWVTNNGSLVKLLEKRLAEYLGVKNIVLVSNGTIALEIAYRVLGLRGFVITTPFSFVATTSSLVTNGLLPIFADINPRTFNIDTTKIEQLITPNTSAILPVHVFGNPCDIESIQSIAHRFELKVIYDAAHAFDVQYRGQSILQYGDISTLSFHATKLFHSIEGGALIINDDALVQKARYLINFGIADAESIPELGTNAKMNEFEAAMGLSVLDEIEHIKRDRRRVAEKYDLAFAHIVPRQEKNEFAIHNHSYYPVLLDNEETLKRIQHSLNQHDIYPRRYFYPSLDTLYYIEPKQYCPISRDISRRILCLPLYPGLEQSDQELIIQLVKEGI